MKRHMRFGIVCMSICPAMALLGFAPARKEIVGKWAFDDCDGADSNSNPVMIGYNYEASAVHYWDGVLDEIRLYDHVLSQSEVADYCSGSGDPTTVRVNSAVNCEKVQDRSSTWTKLSKALTRHFS